MVNGKRKGNKGENEARRLLQARGFFVAHEVRGIEGPDLLAIKDGVSWSVEVKDCVSVDVRKFRAQSIRQRPMVKADKWMLLCHLDGTREWLCMRQGEHSEVWCEREADAQEA